MTLTPICAFSSAESKEELVVGTVCLAVNMNHSFNCFSCIVESLVETNIDHKSRIFVLRAAHDINITGKSMKCKNSYQDRINFLNNCGLNVPIKQKY